MRTNLHDLKELQIDLLKEVGNIGAGHAATALSIMVEKQIDMKVPNVEILHISEVEEYLGGEEQVVVGILLGVEGDVPGNMLFTMPIQSALQLLNDILGENINNTDDLSEFDESALTEIGNILASSYLSSLADFSNLKLSSTVPSMTVDMVGAILNFGLVQVSQKSDIAIVIDTTLTEGNSVVKGNFFLIPDPDSIEKLFVTLGVPM